MPSISRSKLIILTAIFWSLFANMAFYHNVLKVYPFDLHNGPFLISIVFAFGCVIVLLLSLFCYRHTTKPVIIILLLVTAPAAYFMDTYNVIIDDSMIDNIFKTNTAEALDLFSHRLIFYMFALGILPAIFVYKIKIRETSFKQALISQSKLFGFTLLATVLTVVAFGKFYAPFFREHKPLRFYSNPSYYIYSVGKYAGRYFKTRAKPYQQIALDAKIPDNNTPPKLVIMVVGETARADHFSLNGYPKKTNPMLEKQDIINFSDVRSCGTSTAESVPCMFASFGRGDYSKSKAKRTDNLLDILQRAGVSVLWRDNNSDSKGVAVRAQYEDYKFPDKNTICNESECRDMGLLVGLQDYIDQRAGKNIFIVLHQMGNHGPAYYKRYPKKFEVFTPTCQTNQLEQCSSEEINNAYDNAIVYTDYFLSQIIELLKANSSKYETAMYYASDHGESLGENGVYLHGLPYMIAPDTQKLVPSVMWFGGPDAKRVKAIRENMKTVASLPYSHDNIFSTMLGLFNVQTTVYDQKLDLAYNARQAAHNIASKATEGTTSGQVN